jgi:hypothetical protein
MHSAGGVPAARQQNVPRGCSKHRACVVTVTFSATDVRAGVQVFSSAVEELGKDANLPAIANVKRFLLKGIGIHHGGLIPLVKELVEILFQARRKPVSSFCLRVRCQPSVLVAVACE